MSVSVGTLWGVSVLAEDPVGFESKDAFLADAQRYRRELLAHCYRMTGSLHDAEDLVQETYLRAWRFYAGFEGRSSVRRWLYQIATNACLRALERRPRVPLPSGLGAPSDHPERPLTARHDLAWLEPVPDALVGLDPDGAIRSTDPAAVAVARGTLRLAFVAALQHLPARQRAVLILRDVLAFSAGETAQLLETTNAAVNSALQRARAQLARVAPAEDEVAEPAEPDLRALLDRYVAAFENSDVAGLLQVLRDDVVLEMPPYDAWFEGADTVARFIRLQVFSVPEPVRTVLVRANGTLAVAQYLRESDGVERAHAMHVLTFDSTNGDATNGDATTIARIVIFLNPDLFPYFGLPLWLPDGR